jgi:membrane protein insertase Oxa1/YidC/SpoIIIJ
MFLGARAHAEFTRFMTENGINPMLTYIPMLGQAAVFMSM